MTISEDLLFSLRLSNILVKTGISLTQSDCFLGLLQEGFFPEKEMQNTNQCLRDVEKVSCHYAGLTYCLFCGKCGSAMITRDVFCPNCAKDEKHPRLVRLFGGCSEPECWANDGYYKKHVSTLTPEGVDGIQCRHIRSTPVCEGYMITNVGEMLGDIVKSDQLNLLTWSTREEMIKAIKACKKDALIIPLTTLNALSTLKAMGEKKVAEELRQYLLEVKFPEQIRNPLAFVAEKVEEGKLLKHLPNWGKRTERSVTSRAIRR